MKCSWSRTNFSDSKQGKFLSKIILKTALNFLVFKKFVALVLNMQWGKFDKKYELPGFQVCF